MSDDMGFSDLGCYGGEIRTPNLDALAKSTFAGAEGSFRRDTNLVDAAVAISPGQIKGIMKLPLIQLKTAFPFLSKPANRKKSVALTSDQFFGGFANALDRAESDALYAQWNIPSPLRPLR